MSINIDFFLALNTEYFRQTAGMIAMTVAEDDFIDHGQIFLQCQGVVDDRFPSAGIKNKIPFVRLDIRTESMLADQLAFTRHDIVRENRYTTLDASIAMGA